ncbi:hypothetical protein I302_103582 [Kwoniella bestiolae CBS 10118]|uniref:Uncharacterized protein n=1 Tax=Kwoniella bestiolae CBS 10118 TaxID=1296100 RepID=A0AAJ8K6F8_9TREE
MLQVSLYHRIACSTTVLTTSTHIEILRSKITCKFRYLHLRLLERLDGILACILILPRTEGTASTMPLPVERSQGSVSALVARFQTAANRDAEATARENRRASLQPSSAGGTLGNSRRISSSGLWTASPSPSPGNTPRLGDSATLPNVEADKDKEVLKDKRRDVIATERDTKKDAIEELGKKVEELDIKKTTPQKSNSKPDPIEVEVKENDSPSRPPKSPKRLSIAGESVNGMTTLPVPTHAEESRDYEEGKKDISDVDDRKDDKLKSSNAQDVDKPKQSTSSTSTSKPTTTSTPSRKTPSSTRKPSLSPSTTTKPLPPVSTTKSTPKSRLSTTTPTPARARTSLGHQTSTTSTKKPSSSSTATPPVSRTPKPLVPSHTGPTHRTPSSNTNPHTVPSPLKPHLTGTPIKPTASSLAKARIPSGPLSTPSSTSTAKTKRESFSLGRSSGRSSLGGGRNSLSPSPSPAATSIPSKVTASGGGGTGSRLLQGTAASRARSAGVPHHESPSKTSSTTTPAKPPTKAGSTSSIRTPISTTRTPSAQTQNRARTPASSTSTSRVRVKPQSQSQNQTQKNGTTENDTPSKATTPKTPSVGRSPIGRLGLAAAGMRRPEGPMSEKGEKAREEGKIREEQEQDRVEALRDREEEEVKEEMQELTEPLSETKREEELNGVKDGKEDPIQRPKTPSPSPPAAGTETVEVEAPREDPGAGEVLVKADAADGSISEDDQKIQGGEVGNESLEEIPDIE